MNGLLICNKGIEEISSKEIEELIKGRCELREGFVLFEFDKEERLCELSYLVRSAKKVCLVVDSVKFNDDSELIDKSKEIKFGDWLKEGRSFKVIVSSEEEIDKEKLAGKIGAGIIKGISEHEQKVDLEDPDIIVFVRVEKNEAYFCIDFSGKDLSKRDYRIFSSPKNIKSSIAYAMVRFSEYTKGDVLIDPFCLSGSVIIEAALYNDNISVWKFDKDEFQFLKFMDYNIERLDSKNKKGRDEGKIYALDSNFKNVDASKKNAKIAGVNKSISFSRLNIEWLDTKFDKESVDRIVTCLPEITKFSNVKDIVKVYDELFYQAEFVLAKKGKIVTCMRHDKEVEDSAKKKGFCVLAKREVWQGQEKFFVLKFGKK